MMGLFSNLIFMNPWILAGLLTLPGLYYLLRIMPPAPKLIVLPTVRFLKDLIPETQTPSHTPWWILLLRLLIATLVLLALAGPIYNPSSQIAGSGPIRLVIDNGWASAQNWSGQIRAGEDILAQAGREGREIYIFPTAPNAGEEKPVQQGPLSFAESLSIMRGLQPQPWPPNYEIAAETLKDQSAKMDSFWLGSGVDDGKLAMLANEILKAGSLTYYMPEKKNLPVLLKMSESVSHNIQIDMISPSAMPANIPFSIQAMAQDGRILDSQSITPDVQTYRTTASFDIPELLRGDVNMFRIGSRGGAGSVFLLDDRYRKRSVGIVSPPEESESAPFIEAGYYLKRALEPYTTLTMGSVTEILEQEPSVIILPDIDALPTETLSSLEEWVRKGGLLLRFAGPNMTRNDSQNYLVPVPLRKGERTLDGSMTWEQPQKLAAFPEDSPFYGLKIIDDITVRQQILPETGTDAEGKSWARLEDGTPLITAAPLDRGMLVLVHTTATPEWSDLPLTGLYIGILRRIVAIAGGIYDPSKSGTGTLEALSVLDGFGALQEPQSTARAITAEEFPETPVSSSHPPGIYGNSTFRQALNIGDHIDGIKAVTSLPAGAHQQAYGASNEINLMPYILCAALALLFADWFIMLLIAAGTRPFWRFSAVVLLFLLPLPAYAQSDDDIKHADGLFLAYVVTGDPAVDATSQAGLESLAATLNQRTSVEPDGVVGVDPEHDELAFYPVIYWPISISEEPLSSAGTANIQSYLDHGGTIVFDTRDQNYKASSGAETRSGATLRKIVGNLNVPPLTPASKDHVLTKSFYLLDSFPGKYTGGDVWVEQQSSNGRDGVSSVIIGGNDWASAWAAGRGDALSLSGGSRQQELATRFGVNLVIYALTGNYKADQVHMPFILERLGQ